MISVSRIMSYCCLAPEAAHRLPTDKEYTSPEGEEAQGTSWPSRGSIDFDNVCLRYGEDQEDATLKNLTFSIKPNEKVSRAAD